MPDGIWRVRRSAVQHEEAAALPRREGGGFLVLLAERGSRFYRQAMDPTDRDHFATITTPAGSAVTVTFITEQQVANIAEQYGPPAEPLPRPVEAAKGEKEPCDNCGGQGHWYEPVEVESPSGSKITTQKRVNCRPCGGTGEVPK